MSLLSRPIALVKAEGGRSTAGIVDYDMNKDATSPFAAVVLVLVIFM